MHIVWGPSDPELIGRTWNVSACLCKLCLIRVIYSLLYCYLRGLKELTSMQSVRILGGVQIEQPLTAPSNPRGQTAAEYNSSYSQNERRSFPISKTASGKQAKNTSTKSVFKN